MDELSQLGLPRESVWKPAVSKKCEFEDCIKRHGLKSAQSAWEC